MEKLSRRDFHTKLYLVQLLTFSLVNSLCNAQVLTGSVKSVANKWIFEMEQVIKSLRDGKVKQSEWQQQIESLLARVDLKDLLKAIDYDRLAKIAVFPEDHESAENVEFSKIKGLPRRAKFQPLFLRHEKRCRHCAAWSSQYDFNAHGSQRRICTAGSMTAFQTSRNISSLNRP